jgi:2-C-methyl-D-erythritol 4-phosphate cytidylyltransferase
LVLRECEKLTKFDAVKQKIHTIIVAAGSGSRFGSTLPKQFCDLCGRAVLMHTIDAVRRATDNADITLVLSRDMRGLWQEMCEAHGFESPAVVDGGATRWQSVKNALDTLGENDAEIVLVHDGARPIVDAAMVQRLVAAASETGAAIPVVAVTDSLRRVSADNPSTGEAVDRSLYRAVQTPQAFAKRMLIDAYSQPYETTFTDDASVVERSGNIVALVEGTPRNIKITNHGDVEIAKLYLETII